MFEVIAVISGMIIKAIWLMLPAYIANPTAVVFGGGTPVDFGLKWMDGRRILGDGKTFRGLLGGTLSGVAAGLIQMHAAPLNLGIFTYISIFTLSLGALLGDLTKSFFKRRLGYERGAKLVLIDQLDFVLGAWLLTWIFDPAWFFSNFLENLWIPVIVLLLTPLLHRLTNLLGYYLKLKKEPW